MRYGKYVVDEYIIGIGTGSGGEEITEQEYQELLDIIRGCPAPDDGFGYRLKSDLNWEQYELPVVDSEDISEAEALEILLGGGI